MTQAAKLAKEVISLLQDHLHVVSRKPSIRSCRDGERLLLCERIVATGAWIRTNNGPGGSYVRNKDGVRYFVLYEGPGRMEVPEITCPECKKAFDKL